MPELVVKVFPHTRLTQLFMLLAFASMILAGLIGLYLNSIIEIEISPGLIMLLLPLPILLILGRVTSPFIKTSNDPEAILTLSPNGIHAKWDNGNSQDIKWDKMVCVDTYYNGPQKVLRIAPKGFGLKEIQYAEEHLSQSCEEIMKFVHDICPYGKDISFWNENRK